MVSRNLTKKEAFFEILAQSNTSPEPILTLQTFSKGILSLGFKFPKNTLLSVFNAIDKGRFGAINLDQWMKVIPDSIVSNGSMRCY